MSSFLYLLLRASPVPHVVPVRTKTHLVETNEIEQALECQIVPFRSEHLRIAIQSGGEDAHNIYVDAVELFHGGPTPAERAISSVVAVMDQPRSLPAKVCQAQAPRTLDAWSSINFCSLSNMEGSRLPGRNVGERGDEERACSYEPGRDGRPVGTGARYLTRHSLRASLELRDN